MTCQEAVLFVLENRKISAYRMAIQLGVSAIMVSKYKKGDSVMSIATALKFSKLYGIIVNNAANRGRKPNEAL